MPLRAQATLRGLSAKYMPGSTFSRRSGARSFGVWPKRFAIYTARRALARLVFWGLGRLPPTVTTLDQLPHKVHVARRRREHERFVGHALE